MARNKKARNTQQEREMRNPVNGAQRQNENEFPGYPHYSSKEDIMYGKGNGGRVNIDVENLPGFHNATTPHRLNPGIEKISDKNSRPGNTDNTNSEPGIEMGTEADVTPEEKRLLDDDMYLPTPDEDRLRQARLDDSDFDGEKLNEESFGTGQVESGSGLDIDTDPAEIRNEVIGSEDEENQYWSLGNEENDNGQEEMP